jgi:hypothetical protein
MSNLHIRVAEGDKNNGQETKQINGTKSYRIRISNVKMLRVPVLFDGFLGSSGERTIRPKLIGFKNRTNFFLFDVKTNA